MWHLIQHWLAYMTGSLNTGGTPPNYNFWSGFGSDLGEITLIGAALTVYKRFTCHTWWCVRHGTYDFTDAGTGLTYRLCRRCHPEHSGRRLTRRHIARIHDRNRDPAGPPG